MRRTLIAFVFLLLLPAGTALAQTYGAVLTPSQEVPPTTSQGFGNFTMTFDATRANVTINWTVANLGAPISGYHIHEKEAGANGSIVLNVQGLGGTFTGGKLTGTFPIDPAVAARIVANPAGFYANVHTTQFPGGAIRGQLALISGSVINYAAELKGSNEVPPNSSTAFGSAFVSFDTVANTLTWEVTTSGIASPTLAHIHPGVAGVNGSPLITFASGASQITGGRTKGTISIASLTPTQLNDLINSPQNFYVNVHSTAFGGGEIRGQLTAAKEVDLGVAGKVGTFVTDVRVFNPSYDAATTALLEYFPAGTTANTNATNTMVVNIPARGTATLDDVTGSTGLNAAAGIGAIRVSSANAINASSRIFSDQRSAGKGTFGQFLPGVARAAALRRGVLPQLSNNADFRTNVGFFNPNSAAVTVRLELRNETGALVATSTQNFAALSHQQNSIGTYFSGADLTSQGKLTLTFDSSAPIDVYAAVNDNVSADSFVVVAQEDSGVAANQ
ncbi:MAG: CHRD domain-containing protein [Acidobacteriota bacterium]